MKIDATYSFNGGEKFLKTKHPKELSEILEAIKHLDAATCLTKASAEKTKNGRLLFSPTDLNQVLKEQFCIKGWTEKSNGKKGFKEPRITFGKGRFREMDGLKNKVGLEIQFGKYAFVGYDIFSKMVIFNKRGLIDCGIEIIPSRDLSRHLSSGGSNFDQILIELEERGVSNLDIPVYIISVGLTEAEEKERILIQERYTTDRKESLKTLKLRKYKGARPGPKRA